MKTIKLFLAIIFMAYASAALAADGLLSMSGGGNGLTVGTPYKIANYADLGTFRTAINAGTDLTAYVELSANISATGSWLGIGTSTNYFKGSFDGKGYTISGLTNVAVGTQFGFFNYAANGTIIKNLNLTGISFTTSSLNNSSQLGGLIGVIGVAGTVTIDNCHVSGTITSTTASTSNGTARIGGFVGFNGTAASNLTITNSSSNINFTIINNTLHATTSTSRQISCGGFVGENSGTPTVVIVNCFSSGTISTSCVGVVLAGGIAGTISNASSKIYNSYSAMTIDALTTNQVTGTVQACNVGGIAGTITAAAEIKNCIVLNTHLQSRTGNSVTTNVNVSRIAAGTVTNFATNYGYASMEKLRSLDWTGTITGGSGTTTTVSTASIATGVDGLSTTATTVPTAATEALGYLNGALATYSAYSPKTWSMTGVSNPAFNNSITFATKTYSKTTADVAFTQVPTLTVSKGAVTYASDATGVATVDANTGLVNLVGAGTARITATQAAAGSYAGATDFFDVTVTAVAGATVTPSTLTGFSYEYGSGPSSEQSFTITGTGLSSAITVTAPTHYEISTGTGGAFAATSPITINPSSGSVNSTINVRLKAGFTPATYNTENITVASGDFTTKNLVCSGSVVRTIATTIYVDGDKVDDTGNGLSWATAKKSITTASTLASVSGDVVFVKGGTYNLSKSSPTAAGALSTNAGVSFYGSFAGTETLASQRATSDADGNGIVEPWEFTNQTILNFTLTGSGAGFTTANTSAIVSNINGFKFTGSNTASDFSTSNATVTMRISKNIRFENNKVADWTVTGAYSATPINAPFFDVNSGVGNVVVHNCLFEKNTITYTSTQAASSFFHPFIVLGNATSINRNVMSNCVVRNNKVTMDYSGSSITGTESVSQRGLIVSILSPTASYPTTLKNTIIHNNEVSFTPSATLLTCYGAPVYVYNAATTVSDSIINNTIAYNKTTNCSSAGIKFGMDIGGGAAPNHIIMNNVMYNNKNNGSISNFEANLAVPALAGTMIKNNICNGGNFTSYAGPAFVNSNSNVVGNLFDLSDTNTDATKGAFFSNPTTTIGYEANGTVELSRWTIGSGSYLRAKGITTLNTTDKSGFQFANPPSVGGYEYHQLAVSTGTTNISSLSNCPTCDLTVSGSGVELVVNQNTDLKSVTVSPGAKLTISSGTLTATNGITLESDATGTATLMDSYTEPTISATVKQYVTAGRNWYMSAPLSSANSSVLNRGASVVEYNEVTGLWPTAPSLTPGKGYIQVASSTEGSTGTVNFTGNTNSGNVLVTLTNTFAGGKGYNLVGNPYPSYLSWSAVADDNAAANMPTGTMWYRTVSYNSKSAWAPSTTYSLNEIVYNGTRFYKVTTAGTSSASGGPTGSGTGISDGSVIWNYEGSIYLFATISSSGVASPATVSNLVPPMQAFWVKSTGGTLTFKNAMRAHNTGGTNALKAPKSSTNDMKLIRLNVSNGASADEAVIYANTDASNAFDTYDAPKYFNIAGSNQPEIYTQVGAEKLVINAMSELNQGTEIPLGFATEKGNNFTISASEFSNFGSNMQVILKDKQTSAEFNLTTGQPYAFSSTVVNSTNRFSLLFRALGVATGIDNETKNNTQVFVNAANQITIIAAEKCNYAIYNAVGQLIENGQSTAKLQIVNYKLQTGIYVVKVGNQSTRVIIK